MLLALLLALPNALEEPPKLKPPPELGAAPSVVLLGLAPNRPGDGVLLDAFPNRPPELEAVVDGAAPPNRPPEPEAVEEEAPKAGFSPVGLSNEKPDEARAGVVAAAADVLPDVPNEKPAEAGLASSTRVGLPVPNIGLAPATPPKANWGFAAVALPKEGFVSSFLSPPNEKLGFADAEDAGAVPPNENEGLL